MFYIKAAKFIAETRQSFEKIGMINFMHDITFGNNQISMLVEDHQIVSFYNQNKIPMLCTNEFGRTLSDGFYINKVLENQYEDCSVLMPFMIRVGKQFHQSFGKNSLHIVVNEPRCQHLYSLFFNLNENDFLHWIINNGNLLNDFLANYNHTANDIILEAKSEKNRIHLPNSNSSITKTKRIGILHKTSNILIQLSTQQERCVRFLMQGKSIKEIALAMDLSPRTIEHYLARARAILGCSSYRELITSYIDQFQ